jgi:hypothetical protein
MVSSFPGRQETFPPLTSRTRYVSFLMDYTRKADCYRHSSWSSQEFFFPGRDELHLSAGKFAKGCLKGQVDVWDLVI